MQAQAQGMQDIIQEVFLPTDVVVETKNGKRKEKEVLRFPNYLFLKLVYGNNDKLDKELWYRIRNTNGVTGFVAPDPNKADSDDGRGPDQDGSYRSYSG